MSREKKLSIVLIPFLLLHFCASKHTLTPSQTIKDGDVLVSERQTFALGFFSPGKSSHRYLGIWYNKVPERTVVWVANRDNPINDTTGVLSIIDAGTGNLAIHGMDRKVPFWSTNVSTRAMGKVVSAQLLDSGNFVVVHGGDNKSVFAWQSFDYPTHTLLPGMKLGVDRRTGVNRFLTSWKSRDDPGTGEFSYKFDLAGSPPQLYLYKGSTRFWRTGPWTGHGWSGIPQMTRNFIFNVSYIGNEDEVSVVYTLIDTSIFSRLDVNESGMVERSTWHGDTRQWVEFWSAPKEQCDFYGHCGAFGNCDSSTPSEFECECLPGFKPKSERDWYLRDGSGGCVRKSENNNSNENNNKTCQNGDGFIKLERAKMPDTAYRAVVLEKTGLGDCEVKCLSNCTCIGYTSADISMVGGGSGCVTYHGELVDTRVFPSGGQDFYLRVDKVELEQYLKSRRSHGKKNKVPVIVASVAAASFIVIGLLCWLVMRKIKGERGQDKFLFSPTSGTPISPSGKLFDEGGTNVDLRIFHLSTIAAATDNFSLANKLGQGGFGTVYKGQLQNGQEIAVKRLAKNSGQGVEEFKNEVTLIAKLQHRNLVRLLGCCIQHEEKMLIYEYLPNKGLDSIIFDNTRGAFLDWRKRFDIVLGIARGILYLHHDSRLRIIHRDLKASNVLLDAAMNPKISDFGMARIFGGDQIQANTNRVVGTYGYMSPEYAMEGLFSTKSDVFSFGVLLLEIISGRKNNSYYQENSVNLIGHVWELWGEEKALEMVDSSLADSYPTHEVQRCIHIGLLCVQEFAIDRPTMSDVAFMLCNETGLPPPKQPAFILKAKVGNCPDHSSSASVGAASVNEVTITVLEPR